MYGKRFPRHEHKLKPIHIYVSFKYSNATKWKDENMSTFGIFKETVHGESEKVKTHRTQMNRWVRAEREHGD